MPVSGRSPAAYLAARGAAGGVLMGLANLVPGISGGTISGSLPVALSPFIRAVAEVSTFWFRPRSLVVLGSVVAGAAVAIVALAGLVQGLVVDHRWVMYSLFIGLTLGGVPLLYRMVRPADSTVVVASVGGILAMVVLAVVQGPSAGGPAGEGGDSGRVAMLLLAGAAGGAAMILPGISGAYVLLILGQYVAILGAIESARGAAADRDWMLLVDEMRVFVPVGLGVVIGVVGVSNLVRLL
ncbi:MAG: undecaprenyl phosphate translocase family protein, partial [Planctomycetota bacterium]